MCRTGSLRALPAGGVVPGVREGRQGILTRSGRQVKLTDMDETQDLAVAAGAADPGTGLRAVAALRKLVEQLEVLQVRNARAHGWSWQAIAEVLGVTRQAVHQKHRDRG